MKPIKLSAIGAVLALVVITAALMTKSFATKTNRNITGDGFAVLELFTSEGCSSCPPADELLARIQKDSGNKPVYVLAYHVDYWNRQGWKDIFSDPLFSKRQYQYSRQFSGQVYTPQVIVNGKSEFVGGDENAAQTALKEALNTQSSHSISLKAEPAGGRMKIDYQWSGNSADNQLMVAVIEKHAASRVTAGENAGRTLLHAQIVRALHSFNLKPGKTGSEQIDLPAGFSIKGWEIIGFLQSADTGVISAAGRAELLPVAETQTATK